NDQRFDGGRNSRAAQARAARHVRFRACDVRKRNAHRSARVVWGSARVPRVGERILRSRTSPNACACWDLRTVSKDCFGATPKPARGRHDLMTWVTLFPLRSATIGGCTPRHFCSGENPFFPLELRGLAKSKCLPLEGKTEGTYRWRVLPM